MKRLLFIITEDWYFISHRLHIAKSALSEGYKVAILCRCAGHYTKIIESGIDVISWSVKRKSLNPFLELLAFADVIKAIFKFKPTIVHAVALKPVLYSAIASKLINVHALVFAIAGLGFIFSSTKFLARILRPLLILVFRLAFKGSNVRVIVQNPDDKHTLLMSKIVESKRIELIKGAGVDTKVFTYVREPEGYPAVILPARMLWGKGVGTFVECARTLKSRGSVARFVLVGAPDKQNHDCVPVEQLKLWVDEGVVEWWGHCDDMSNVIRQASIVCLPSTYGEGLPKVLLEAASSGRSIVTFDAPGCREVVEDGVNGYLVPLRDKAALVNALEYLLGNSELRLKMGLEGRKKVEREFSQEKIANETLKVWAEVSS